MKDKVKKALKRFSSGFMAVLLAVCLVCTPKAKAVVTEGALLGSIFGSLLVSMGFSWAAENMDVPTFGESIYKLIQEHDEANKDTGVQLIRDLSLASLLSGKPGTIQFNYAWTQAARSFAEWFETNYFTSGSTVSKVINANNLAHINGIPGSSGSTLDYPYTVNFGDGHGALCIFEYQVTEPCKFVFVPTNAKWAGICLDEVRFRYNDNFYGQCMRTGKEPVVYEVTQDQVTTGIKLEFCIYDLRDTRTSGEFSIENRGVDIYIGEASTLTAEKPAEVHYPDVAEDGSQVYEVTYQGVTATDIEGIIQGAVDRILAGTASIVGSVEQAGTVVNPDIDPYKVGLSSVFPFCIPFDVYNMVTMFVAEPEAPHAEWTFSLPWSNQEYSVGWDLSDFNGVAQVCRSMELVLFVVGLAAITHKFIKW